MTGGHPGVLFDVDGTLLDTNYLHVLAWSRALRSHGHPEITMASIHHSIGIASEGLVRRLIGTADDSVIEAHSAAFADLRDQAVAFPGVPELLRRCRDAGLTVALATSGKPDDLDWMLPAIEGDDWIIGAVTSEDVDESKPAPDLLTAGIAKFGLDADRTVAVGDSVWDVEAARQAGIASVALECGGTSRQELEAVGATEIHRDPATLAAHFGDSVLAAIASR
jgi:phosphoglycolate phosphatase-like HAD superfamily hydrolase